MLPPVAISGEKPTNHPSDVGVDGRLSEIN
jgi:hypothetical protein